MDSRQYEAFLKNAINEIRESEQNNNLSILAGSGVSIASNLPSWQSLISAFKNKLGLDKTEKDYLKIAELFYLQFESNLYLKEVRKFFPSSSKPNILHEQITSLNINNLITTNWDDLFEKQIEEQGLFYDIITSDADLGKYTGNRKLIKAHGCINSGEIVFKESDYLEYNDNFPLIDSYLKGVFSTDTILIVGYSLSDLNIKQIIGWVNSKSKNVKPIYLLKVNANFDYLEFKYYKKKNIFILYWNEPLFHSDEENKLDKKSSSTAAFFNKINRLINYSHDLTIEKVVSVISEVVDKYSSYPALIFSTVLNEVRSLLRLNYGELAFFNKEIIVSSERLRSVLNNNENITFSNIRLARKLMKLVGAGSIKIGNVNLRAPKIDRVFEDYLLGFEFKNLDIKINNNSPINIEDENRLLLTAYYKYQARDFEDSYEVLIKASRVALRNKNYFAWYLAEFNKTHLQHVLINAQGYSDSLKLKSYFEESRKIDLSEQLLRLPLKFRSELKPFLDFERTLDETLVRLLIAIEEHSQSLDIVFNGGFSATNYVNEALEILDQIQSFVTSYYLTIQYTPKIKKAFEAIIKIVLIEHAKNKIYFLSNITFSFGVLYYTKPNEFYDFLEKSFSETLFQQRSEEEKSFTQLFKNIVENRIKNNFFDNFSSDLLDKAAIFLAYTELAESDFSKIIQCYSKLLNNHQLNINNYRWLNLLLVRQFNKNESNLPLTELTSFIDEYISYIIAGRNFIYTVRGANSYNLFGNIFSVLKNTNEDYMFEDLRKIQDFTYHLKKQSLATVLELCEVILFSIHPVASEEVKQELDRFFDEILGNKSDDSETLLEFKFMLAAYEIKPELKEEVIEKAKTIEGGHTQRGNLELTKLKEILLAERVLKFFTQK